MRAKVEYEVITSYIHLQKLYVDVAPANKIKELNKLINTGIPWLLKGRVRPLHFYRRPALVPLLTNWEIKTQTKVWDTLCFMTFPLTKVFLGTLSFWDGRKLPVCNCVWIKGIWLTFFSFSWLKLPFKLFFYIWFFVYRRTKISWLSGIQKVPTMAFSDAMV